MSESQRPLSVWKWVLNMRLHARIGAAVAVIFTCGIAAGVAARYLPHHEIFIWSSSAALLIAGLLALRRNDDAESEHEQGASSEYPAPQSVAEVRRAEYPPSVFTRRYWGWVALGCAVSVFLAPTPGTKKARGAPSPVLARTPPPPPLETNEPANIEPATATFPALRLQGIHLLPSHPAAIINGKTYVAGDVVAGASIVQINPDSVMMEMDGQRKLLMLAGELQR